MTTTAKESKAYQDGYKAGLAWDLDGFKTLAEALSSEGWDASTLNAVSDDEIRRLWGLRRLSGPAFERACDEYTLGVKAGIQSPEHHGTKPGQCTACGAIDDDHVSDCPNE